MFGRSMVEAMPKLYKSSMVEALQCSRFVVHVEGPWQKLWCVHQALWWKLYIVQDLWCVLKVCGKIFGVCKLCGTKVLKLIRKT
jgi:hypothetical protein